MPWPPMLNMPPRKAIVTARPPKISGVASSSVLVIGPKNCEGVPETVAGLKIEPLNRSE